ncbi:DUF883 family protein [Paracoccus luteus]|uniref:DUF883 family protein n=1 Tax=Paracoccus luteus TaxID=2508543 RepID=UPI00106F82DF|nr:DUF883 family protein [Paracoccus luteus]
MATDYSTNDLKKDVNDAANDAKDTAQSMAKDAKQAASDTVDKIKHSASDIAATARERGEEFVATAKEKGAEYADRARSEADRLYREGERRAGEMAAHASDYYDEMSDMVRRKPAQALGIAAGVGFLVGLILARR